MPRIILTILYLASAIVIAIGGIKLFSGNTYEQLPYLLVLGGAAGFLISEVLKSFVYSTKLNKVNVGSIILLMVVIFYLMTENVK